MCLLVVTLSSAVAIFSLIISSLCFCTLSNVTAVELSLSLITANMVVCSDSCLLTVRMNHATAPISAVSSTVKNGVTYHNKLEAVAGFIMSVGCS